MADPAPRPDTTRLQRLVHSYRDAAALMAAVELGLFTQVARGADTEAAIARALALTPTNATAVGNVLLQAMGRGRIGSLADARAIVARSFPVVVYEPRDTAVWNEAADRFATLVPA